MPIPPAAHSTKSLPLQLGHLSTKSSLQMCSLICKDAQNHLSAISFVTKHPSFSWTQLVYPHLIDCESVKAVFVAFNQDCVYWCKSMTKFENSTIYTLSTWAQWTQGQTWGRGDREEISLIDYSEEGSDERAAACIIHKYSLQQKRFQSLKDWNMIVMIHKTKIFCRKIEPI